MKVKYEASFKRDLKRIRNRQTLRAIGEVIDKVKQAEHIRKIKNVKKLKNWPDYYRIKVGTYRIGVKKSGKILKLTDAVGKSNVSPCHCERSEVEDALGAI